jgi:hypothetical protein
MHHTWQELDLSGGLEFVRRYVGTCAYHGTVVWVPLDLADETAHIEPRRRSNRTARDKPGDSRDMPSMGCQSRLSTSSLAQVKFLNGSAAWRHRTFPSGEAMPAKGIQARETLAGDR